MSDRERPFGLVRTWIEAVTPHVSKQTRDGWIVLLQPYLAELLDIVEGEERKRISKEVRDAYAHILAKHGVSQGWLRDEILSRIEDSGRGRV